MAKSNSDIDGTKRLMAALGRMPPKPHEEMKIGKAKKKKAAKSRQPSKVNAK
jgi:hypothetical protein